MKNYYRVMLGEGSKHSAECFANSFIGTDYEIEQDLSDRLYERWQAFNKEFIPVYQTARPGKSKIAAGLAMGALWTVSKGIQRGEIVLCPDGSGACRVGEVVGDYQYQADGILPHRRQVRWLDRVIDLDEMSAGLRASVMSRGTVPSITKHAKEIETLIVSTKPTVMTADGEAIEDPVAFAMEKHLEDFLVANWAQTEFGKDFEVYQEDGEFVGQQYPSDTGPLDILAISKDRKRLLVVELKKGRASDQVVGQILRYMNFVQDELAENDQTVEGAIVALEDDQRLRRAIAMVPSVRMYRYAVNFKLVKT